MATNGHRHRSQTCVKPAKHLCLPARRHEHVDRNRSGAVLAALDDLDPDTLSPRQALEALYRLKTLCRESLYLNGTCQRRLIRVEQRWIIAHDAGNR